MNPQVELELFGVNRSFRYQTIKKQLVRALRQSGVSYTLSDIGDIDKFIEIGLDSVPAIRVDHEQLFSMRDPENPHKAVESVYKYIAACSSPASTAGPESDQPWSKSWRTSKRTT